MLSQMDREWNGTRILFSMLGNNEDAARARWQISGVIYRPLAPYAFFDESGKWKDKDFICLCGYLSGERHWGLFTDQWTELRHDHKLAPIHLTTFFYECKKRGWDENKATKVLERFIDIIREHVWCGFAIGFDAKHYRGMAPHAKKALGDPALACLHRLLRLVRDRYTQINYTGRISISFDEDEEYASRFYKTVLRLRKHDQVLAKLIGAVSFADDEFIVPLQAADIVANLTSKWFHDQIAGKATPDQEPPLLKRLLTAPDSVHGIEYCTELWDAKALDENWKKLAVRP